MTRHPAGRERGIPEGSLDLMPSDAPKQLPVDEVIAKLKPLLEEIKARGLVYVGESNNSSAAVRQVALNLLRQETSDKEYVLYPEFGHILDFEDDRQTYWDDLAAWLDRRS